MKRPRHFAGLDAVRVLAIGLVTAQHSLTLLHHDSWSRFGSISIGQLGVDIFLFISGFLASQSQRPPVAWLQQRLLRLMPAYWIAIAASFLMAAVVGHKSFDAAQVFSQFAGLGFWTHREEMINSPTWFVSVLLVCYLSTFLTRIARAPQTLSLLAFVVLCTLVIVSEKPWLIVHFITYTAGSILGTRRAQVLTMLALTPMFLTAAFLDHPDFLSPALTLLVVAVGLLIHRVPHWIGMLANYSYEYYLVHGVFLYGAIRVLHAAPLLALAVGIATAAVAAVALQWLVKQLVGQGRDRQ